MGLLRRLLPYTSIAVVLALAYAGWTLLSRKRVDRIKEQAAEAEKGKADRKIVQAYGEGGLKILMFYANPPTLRPGEKGLLCYGVANARTIRIEPQLEAVTPSLSRCLEVSPRVNTKYTLIAEDAAGKSDRRIVAISVR